jgi:serine O-acetyltransferase
MVTRPIGAEQENDVSLHKWLEDSSAEIAQQLSEVQKEVEKLVPGRDFIIAEYPNVSHLLDDLIAILIPGYRGFGHGGGGSPRIRDQISTVALVLQEQVRRAFEYEDKARRGDEMTNAEARADEAVRHVFESLASVKQAIREDLVAAYEGDPAALSVMEIVMSYPCVIAIVTYRLAHLLYERHVPLLPRMMTELAHSRTGIDINPGAQIGPGFFIDHGTGVVIGETCVIGRRVKLYQGVTLGALSFPKDEHGRVVKGIKRHPNVEDNVTIYAGATILGGETTIGAGTVIGGNVWLTHSVPPNSTVYNQQPDPLIKSTE